MDIMGMGLNNGRAAASRHGGRKMCCPICVAAALAAHQALLDKARWRRCAKKRARRVKRAPRGQFFARR